METITVKEFLAKEIDVDVYDDYDERIWIAFCGPIDLTEEGLKKFGEVLDTKVDFYGDCATLHVEDDVKRLNKLDELFLSLAGYCLNSDYDKWFV